MISTTDDTFYHIEISEKEYDLLNQFVIAGHVSGGNIHKDYQAERDSCLLKILNNNNFSLREGEDIQYLKMYFVPKNSLYILASSLNTENKGQNLFIQDKDTLFNFSPYEQQE